MLGVEGCFGDHHACNQQVNAVVFVTFPYQQYSDILTLMII
jgi:hypothetical protein